MRQLYSIRKRILAVVMSVVLICSLNTTELFRQLLEEVCCRVAAEMVEPAKQTDADGKVWYLISSASELRWFADFVNSSGTASSSNYVNVNAKLTKDIMLSDLTLSDGRLVTSEAALTPFPGIGDQKHKYIGTFDGQGHMVHGFYYQMGTEIENAAGLFKMIACSEIGGVLYQGTIKNLNICNSYLHSKATNTGGLVGMNQGGIIKNCSFEGVIASEGLVAGGLVGSNLFQEGRKSYKGTISDCYADVVLNSSHGAGGLVGQNSGLVEHSYSMGSVCGNSSERAYGYCGGIVGACGGTYQNLYSNYGLVVNCYSNAVVTSNDEGNFIGAIAGRPSGGYFVNCYGSGYQRQGLGAIQTQGKSSNTGMDLNNYYYEGKELVDGEQKYVGKYRQVAYNCYYVADKDMSAGTTLNYNEVAWYHADTFATGEIAHRLNHGNRVSVYQAFGIEPKAAYGQYLKASGKTKVQMLPAFLMETLVDGSNEVHQIVYEGDVEETVYANDSVVLPKAESGYYYEFIYKNTDRAGEVFTGKDIVADCTVTVTKISAIPAQNKDGIFEIKNATHLCWFGDYVNGKTVLEGSSADATKADAILLADIDMTGIPFAPMGSRTSVSGEVSYDNAYKGHFDGRYHVITGLHVGTMQDNEVGLFGVTYGARIERLGLEDASVMGKYRVGGIAGEAVGTKIINCYITGKLAADKEFVGGIVGTAGIRTHGAVDEYPSQSFGTEVYRCYADITMEVLQESGYVAGISGNTDAVVSVAGEQQQVSYANCYFNQDKAGFSGAVSRMGKRQDDDKAEVTGYGTKEFEGGKVCWLLQLASMQQGDSYLTPDTYAAVELSDSVEPGNPELVKQNALYIGTGFVTLRNNALIWCQQVSGGSGKRDQSPKFADRKKTEDKAASQIYRYAAINVNRVYEENEELVERYGNTGFTFTLPESFAEYPQELPIEQPQYFVGWTKSPLTEKGDTLLSEGFVVTRDSYIYAYYDSEGRIFITSEQKDATYTYGRTFAGEEFAVRATCTMSKEPGFLTYQWYEKVGNEERLLVNEVSNNYRIPVDLNAGKYQIFCRVTAQNGVVKDSDCFALTITKKQLTEELFERIGEQYYNTNALTPKVTIATEEEKLMKESDFNVSYEQNVNLTTDIRKAKALVTATQSGNYEGSVSLPFVITYLPVRESMYHIDGVWEEDCYLDKVSVTPAAGYTLSNRFMGVYGSSPIVLSNTGGQEVLEYRFGFYLREEATGALTDQVTCYVKIRNTKGNGNAEATTQAPPTTQNPPQTDIKPSENPGQPPFGETLPVTDFEPIVDATGETLSYYDGLGKPETGNVYIIGNYRYKVISSTYDGGTVTLNKVVNRKLKKSNIPIYVTINGFHYLVTKVDKKAFYGLKKLTLVRGGDNVKSIGASAFAGCKKLKKVTLGKKVKSIGASAFAKDKKLASIKINSKKLQKVGKKCFTKTKAGLIIKVPKNVKKKYKKLLAKKGQKRGRIQ